MKCFHAIGMMSGTSLDGIDLAYCNIRNEHSKWTYEIIAAETIPYCNSWKKRLDKVPKLDAEKLVEEHIAYGFYLGKLIRQFIDKNKLTPDLIASHGHTVFHDPENKINFQLGDGNAIASLAKAPVVWDFRSIDIRKGGQGAPLVPVGDRLFFQEYDYCLNLGGFSNISFEDNKTRYAFDICPVNMAINHFAGQLGYDIDRDGHLARKGEVSEELLDHLNALSYYQKPWPKSLGREWFQSTFLPVVIESKLSHKDRLRTIYEHIAIRIKDVTAARIKGKILLTGGGAHNTFLMERIRFHNSNRIIKPDQLLIEYKEALIFGLLGVLRWENKVNCLGSVTGAFSDSSAGLISLP
ncbi:MAG: anhydro-N-acetylmuramic acid kinase [Bacteroidales bacterium]|nr:anhydro-N-acetylmuramic acid kinase [Bacteroidales bacterium]MCF8343422.1 anhydro-N-acetylmuramic acid kinase [Bacteroidales bacterium]MCF8349862.1 anhydro-N-acetylmuramic acid kinase [Bacteroidales bacterium]MCF8375542.1 anhydro-N-acetylmuramic acid kinase [Bacteroidales bacterium]MCF8399941.1 anhydro-N-acetylmuramic acid kinase [Bacteroidales bacterium]